MRAPSRHALLFLALCLAPFAAAAGAFGVSPIRVDLDPSARTALVTVSNDDERKLYFQVKLFAWTQSPSGEDRLDASDDLIFFPQIFDVEPKDKRLIRVGLKDSATGRERAFRLFIEELPDPNEPAPGRAQIAVRLRFGVPIFLSPGKGEAKPEITAIDAVKGALRVAIENRGDRSIRFEEVTAKSGDRVVARAVGWYVFPGTTRTFSLPVAAADCPVSPPLEVHASADGKDVLHRPADVSSALCAP